MTPYLNINHSHRNGLGGDDGSRRYTLTCPGADDQLFVSQVRAYDSDAASARAYAELPHGRETGLVVSTRITLPRSSSGRPLFMVAVIADGDTKEPVPALWWGDGKPILLDTETAGIYDFAMGQLMGSIETGEQPSPPPLNRQARRAQRSRPRRRW